MTTPLELKHLDAALDEGLRESFPASDPLALSFPDAVELARRGSSATFSGSEKPKKSSKPGHHKEGKGSDPLHAENSRENQEIELKLQLDAAHVNQFVLRMPLKEYVIGKSRVEKVVSTYYDTPDLALKREGLSLRLRHADRGWVQTLKSTDTATAGLFQRSEWECPLDGPTFDFLALRQMMGGQRKHVGKLLRGKLPLSPLFMTDIKRTTWNLQLPAGGKIEFSLDQGSVAHNALKVPICEIELELKSGEPEDIFTLALQLLDVMPMHIGNLSKSARGYALCLPPQPISAIAAGALQLRKQMTVEEGFKAIVADCVAQIGGNQSGLIQNSDPEVLHEMRVGLRRLESALELFDRIASLPAEIQDELNWLSSMLGPARDWEVLSGPTLSAIAASAPDDAGLSLLRRSAIDIAGEKCGLAVSAVQSVRFTRLMLTLARWLECASWRREIGKSERHKLNAPLPRFVQKCLSHDQRRLLRRGKVLDPADPKKCHKTRIAAKTARYTAEFFRSLYPKKKIQGYVGVLIALQDELGGMNDAVVADNALQELGNKRQDLLAGIAIARDFLNSKVNRKVDKLWKRFASKKLPVLI